MGLEVYSLPRDFGVLLVNDPAEQYWSACLEVSRCSHVILVWHIATSLCEVKLAQDLKSSGILKSALSFLRKHSSRLRRYPVHETLGGSLRTNYVTANCMSRYCAYLLVSRPELLPGKIWVSKQTFQDTVQCAREILNGCGSLQKKYDRLITASQRAEIPGGHNIKLSGNILQQGAMLGYMLINDEDQESRWEILAKVWARLLVHIAPSSNAEAHAKHLDSGALFTHCGIEKSELWQEDAVPGSNASPGSPGPSGRQNSPVAATHVQQQVTSDIPAATQPDARVGDLDDDEGIPEIVVTSPTPGT
uniref:DUF4220 domain-containing protein n=1 Tax=Leersia perrieri TaxID=77586 RepID=A0A0D9XU78_9ORYZ